MCGKYVSPDEAAIEREWDIGRRYPARLPLPASAERLFSITRYNVAPTTLAPIARFGEPILSCAVVTRAALGRLAEVHDRMPVVLTPEMPSLRLDPDRKDPAAVDGIVARADGSHLAFHPVDTRVNAGRGDDPGMIARVELPAVT